MALTAETAAVSEIMPRIISDACRSGEYQGPRSRAVIVEIPCCEQLVPTPGLAGAYSPDVGYL